MENNKNVNNNNISKDEEEEDLEDYEKEGVFFYGNDYFQNFQNIFGDEKNETQNQTIILNSQNTVINEYNEIINLEKTLNIICKINPETIINLFELDKNEIIYKSLLRDKIGQIDFNSVIIREYLPNINQNIAFYNKYFQIVSKVVYPTIQIFYGILNKQNQNNNVEIVLEYISSDLEEVQTFIKKCLNGNNINYLIINKISEVLSYIY